MTQHEDHVPPAENGARRTKVLIVDDHPVVRQGLRHIIQAEPDLEVCGEADDVLQAVEQVRKTRPDVVIVDIALKTGNGLDLIKRILSFDESIAIVVSSMYEDSLYARRALRSGALGYVNKQTAASSVVTAIRRVLTGSLYLSEETAQKILQMAAQGEEQAGSQIDTFSDRELSVFEMIGQGLTTRQIAERLHLSVKTVETYRENIKAKLRITNSAELSRHAVQWVLENVK